MASNLVEIKNRIELIKSSKKITDAMKIISSVKEKKYLKEFYGIKTYSDCVNDVYNNTVFLNPINPEVDQFNSELLKQVDSKKVLYILVFSTSGLCGAYNQNIIKFFKTIYHKEDEILLIGQKGISELKKEKAIFNGEFIDLNKKPNFLQVKKFILFLIDKYKSGNYKEIRIVYSHYINSLISRPVDVKMIPLSVKENKKRNYSSIFEPNKEMIVERLIEEVLISSFLNYLYDSLISEFSSRKIFMENASKNADELIEKLTLEYNKERQNSITEEINEVINGSRNKGRL